MCAPNTTSFTTINMGKFANWFRTVGRSIEDPATGVVHFATHVVDEGFSTAKALGNDVVGVAHEASGAVKRVSSSLAFPLALGAAGIVAVMFLKR